ncbi:MAG: BspA family leucine-rich repeat surface protein [Clostridia bacterium]|nr:BspA family leucine-rich repeat surface protein [Clostridia bacterium]
MCYWFGNGVAEDKAEAAKWYRKAAEQGHEDAQRKLNNCCSKENGAGRNNVDATKPHPQVAPVQMLKPQKNNILKSDYGDSVFGNTQLTRETITSITFRDTLADMPQSAWDASEAQDGSVMAWVENQSDLIIAGEGGVTAGRSCAHMFKGYKNVTQIDFNGCFDTSDVSDMEGMFRKCRALKSLDVSRWNTSNVTNMVSMFNGCTSLSSLDVSRWNTSNVTSMWEMFYKCWSLSSLDVSRWNTSNVTSMWNMFQECRSLNSLDISRWDTSNVTNMSHMFFLCSNLHSIGGSLHIPANCDTTDMYKGSGLE